MRRILNKNKAILIVVLLFLTNVSIILSQNMFQIAYQGNIAGHFPNSQQFCKTSDNGFLITNALGTNYAENLEIIKTDNSGAIIWSKKIGTNNNIIPQGIFNVSDLNNQPSYIIYGVTTLIGNGMKDIVVINIDNNGNIIWQKIFGGQKNDKIKCGIQLSNKQIVLAGSSESSSPLYNLDMSLTDRLENMFAIKLDINGNIIWKKSYAIASYEFATSLYHSKNEEISSIIEDTNGNIKFTGYTDSNNNIIYGTINSTNGNLLSIYSYNIQKQGYNVDCIEKGVKILNINGKYFIVGESNLIYNLENTDIVLFELNENGTASNLALYDFNYGWDQVFDAIVDNGSIIIAGQRAVSIGGNYQGLIMKINNYTPVWSRGIQENNFQKSFNKILKNNHY